MTTILFIIPPNRGWDGKLLPLRFPHIGVGYLAAFLKERGINVKALDTSLDFRSKTSDIEKAVAEYSPDIIGLTVYSNLVNEARAIVSDIKKITSTPIVAGGPHISVTGTEFLKETGLELGITKDGERPLYGLITALFGGPEKRDLHEIPGLIFKDRNGEYVVQENTDLIHNLDEIPFPDWNVFDLERYSNWGDRSYQIITSRGCPYACTYCAAPLVTGRRFRIRSSKNVVDEIELYVKKGFKRFGIGDDAFNVNINRAKEVCRLIIERKLDIVWDMGNGIRANTVDREFFQLLKKSGCNFVGFGLESGNEEMLKKIKKGLTLDQMYKALEFANEVGIGTAVNFIIGHPGETYETAMDTLKVAQDLPASYVNMYGLMPMKGTEAYNQLKAMEAEGKAVFFYDHDYYLSHFSGQGIEPVFETPELTRAQRRKLLIMARNITKKKAFEYRFGRIFGGFLYLLTRNHKIFTFVNNLRNTVIGGKIYQRIRREQ